MTSLAAALGMMPLAWAFGSGADMLRPLVIAVIGGLYEQQQIAFRGLTVQRLSRGRRAAKSMPDSSKERSSDGTKTSRVAPAKASASTSKRGSRTCGSGISVTHNP
jgi:hypothetical protein